MGSLLRSVSMAPPGSPRVLLAGNPPWEREASGTTVVCGVPVAETTMGWLAMTLLVFQGDRTTPLRI